MSIFSLEAPANTSDVYFMLPDINTVQSVQKQLLATSSSNCLSNLTRAGVMCERFRCQMGSDPSVGDASKLLSAIVKISFDSDPFTICHGYLVAPSWVVTTASCLAYRYVPHDQVIVRLIDRLIEWSIDWLINWLVDWSINWLIDWLIDWVIDWLIDGLMDWLIDWLIEFKLAWLVDSDSLIHLMKCDCFFLQECVQYAARLLRERLSLDGDRSGDTSAVFTGAVTAWPGFRPPATGPAGAVQFPSPVSADGNRPGPVQNGEIGQQWSHCSRTGGGSGHGHV